METLCEPASQSPAVAESGKGHKGQEGLLQEYQQKED